MSDTPEPNDAAHCSAVPLRWRVRWFVRGMRSILVPISAEELRREVDQCVDEQMKKWREENPAPPVQYTGSKQQKEVTKYGQTKTNQTKTMNKPQDPEALPLKICSASMGREEIALAIFTALLPRVLDKADRMAFPEGALKLMKLEISAAWEMADLWISEREDSEPNIKIEDA